MSPNLCLSPFILLSILTTWISGTLAQSPSSDLFSTCSNLFTCGATTGISYPFWGGSRTVACGYPELELKCVDNIAMINLSNVTYRFLGIPPDARVMKLVREDYSSGSFCSPVLTNSTFDPAVFETSNAYTNFTFIYGCPTIPATTTSNKFSCNISGIPIADGYMHPGEIGPDECFASVFFPVPQSLLTDFDTSQSNLSSKLQQGFEIGLNVSFSTCASCNQSKGVCGYDQATNRTTCYCSDGSTSATGMCATAANGPQEQTYSKRKTSMVIGVLGLVKILGGSAVVGILLFVCISLLRRKNGHRDDVDAMIRSQGSVFPRRYKYRHLKKLTRSFSDKLGEGGYGEVYKGKLRDDGRLVAVKILKDSRGDGEEFINEVVSISRTAHVNIVELLGFCYEGKKRALLYNYMPNGSLDKFLPKSKDQGSPNCPLEWKVLHRIAVGIARGLEYLHQGCNTRILHFDIKPQNILLDHDFTPKISDFGLAKLCQGRESIVSMLGTRGTIGYIAPEVFSRNFGAVSHKSDVYSYGMLIFEVIGGKDTTGLEASRSSEMYFPEWVYKHLESGKALWMPEINTPEDEEIARKMMIVSLWCIQTNPSDRPSMSKVIEMMEGSIEMLRVPQKPLSSSPLRLAGNGRTTTMSSSVQSSWSTLLIAML